MLLEVPPAALIAMKGAGGGDQYWEWWDGKWWTWDQQQGWRVDPGNERGGSADQTGSAGVPAAVPAGAGAVDPAGSAGVPTADPDAMILQQPGPQQQPGVWKGLSTGCGSAVLI